MEKSFVETNRSLLQAIVVLEELEEVPFSTTTEMKYL